MKDKSDVHCTIDLKVAPNARRNEVVGWEGSELKVRVQAPPEGGRANREVERLFAKALGTPRSRVELVGGQKSRHKRLRIEGMDAPAVFASLDVEPGPHDRPNRRKGA